MVRVEGLEESSVLSLVEGISPQLQIEVEILRAAGLDNPAITRLAVLKTRFIRREIDLIKQEIEIVK